MAYQGKNAVITGGTGGIGLGIARQLLIEGAQNIALVDIQPNDKMLKRLQENFKEQNIILAITDITKRESIENTFKEINEQFKRIDIVVCGAGILNEKDPVATITVNVLGVINTTFVAMDYMGKDKEGHGGDIISIASVAGLTSFPGAPSYTASKHALIGFTRSMSHEVLYKKTGIKHVVICPGLTITNIIHEFEKKLLCAEVAEYFMANLLGTLPTQTANQAAKCLIDLIPTAKNGSVWIVDDNQIEEVTIPKYWRI